MTERSVGHLEIIAALTQVFRDRGYAGASLSLLSAATGLKKASLYYHFPGGKQEMAEVVLDEVAAWFADRIFTPLRGNDPLESRLEVMRAALDEHYGGGEKGCLFAMLALGETRDRFASRTAAFFGAWIAALGDALAEAGFEDEDAVRRAADVVMAVEGALLLSRALGDTGPFQRVLRRLPAVLLGDGHLAEAAAHPLAALAPDPPAGAAGDFGEDWIDQIPDARDLAAMLGDQTVGAGDASTAENDNPRADSDREDAP